MSSPVKGDGHLTLSSWPGFCQVKGCRGLALGFHCSEMSSGAIPPALRMLSPETGHLHLTGCPSPQISTTFFSPGINLVAPATVALCSLLHTSPLSCHQNHFKVMERAAGGLCCPGHPSDPVPRACELPLIFPACFFQ